MPTRWISAKTPPDSAREVLVITDDDLYWVANYNRAESVPWKSAETGGNLLGVHHWRPLPRKPKGGT